MTEAVAEIKESHAKLGGCYVRCLGQNTINQPVCLVPGFDGALFSREWKEALWARFTTEAPRRQRQSVEQ
ncbi:hypothetical protein, partial [Brytella acorum]